MREAIPPPLKRSPSLYTREAYFIRNQARRNAVQKRRGITPSFLVKSEEFRCAFGTDIKHFKSITEPSPDCTRPLIVRCIVISTSIHCNKFEE